MSSNKEEVYNIFKMDKKREGDAIHFVLLEEIGKAITQAVPISELKQLLDEL
jgi:3-dehydroquinate synthase